MIRLVHSADWQLGARFTRFGEKGPPLREARVETLRRALNVARNREADAFIVAGDLFEDNQVDAALVASVVRLFGEFASLPIYLLPGNHDPFTGPDCVWQRRVFLEAPPHIHVLAEPAAVDLGGAFLLASPLRQKISTLDPSLKLAELAATLPADAIRIGVTHGALAIEGRHQPNDFPIALHAASRAGLDYLAIGHWHNWLADTDGGRIVMPGTPEPDGFDRERCGFVALVEIESHGAPLRIEPVPVGSLVWREIAFDLLTPESSRAALSGSLAALAERADRAVVRVVLQGSASPAVIAETRAWIEDELRPFLAGLVADRSTVALSEAELAELRDRHPILAQVLADIDQIERLATGQTSSSAEPMATPLTLAEAGELLGAAKIDLAALSPAQFAHTRQLLLQTLQEVAGS